MILNQEHSLNSDFLDTIIIELKSEFEDINYKAQWKKNKKIIHPKVKSFPFENKFEFQGHILNKYFPFIRRKVCFGGLYVGDNNMYVTLLAQRPILGFPYFGNYLAGEEKINLVVERIGNQYELKNSK